MTSDYLKLIAKARVYDVAIESPLEEATLLSGRLNQHVWLKREDLQPVFSFKLRGAYNKLATLTKKVRKRGVICSSAGNHGQGVAFAGRELGLHTTIVMPDTTPAIKVDAVRMLGGEAVLHGANYDEAQEYVAALAGEKDLTFVHPFDDPAVIAGQGTIAVEIFQQHPESIDAIFVPVGGGGLIAAIAMYSKSVSPKTRIIGVEPVESASMNAALAAGHPVTLDHVGTFADGVAVKRVGDETFRLAKEFVDDMILVDTDDICAAIQDGFQANRAILEPAGALALAGLKKYAEATGRRNQTLVAICSGANMNFNGLRHVAERAAAGEHTEALLAVEIPERPGSFLKFCKTIGRRNVTEFNYRIGDEKTAKIFVGLELRHGAREAEEIVRKLHGSGYPVLDLTHNEVATLHIRHMVGGIAPKIRDERILRFEFPERPGALLEFLEAIGDRWNISLFHYRNHGSDYGRVLAGVQVPESERPEFERHLEALAYPYWDESDNPAYRIYLSGKG